MKNSKLALGLGIGAAIGGAVTYLTTTKEGKRLQKRASDAVSEMTHKAEGKYYETKGKVKDAAYKAENKIEDKVDKVKNDMNHSTAK